ncbi:uncharacterized protein LOC125012431 [Mugil cephalus]|uniref:uncharacterized protein LOC125012431 n=1 Tax=Mugil cephalus TaxID=48193 RepID=UPI001FB81642|nr:uncharacterized protein LOC125012431 [Mugil cephalus]
MRTFTLITVLFLCSYGWTSVSASEFQVVEVRNSEEVTLMCSNISTAPTQTDWFRVVNRTEPSCIASMYDANSTALFCDGVQHGNFEMSSNITTVFLKIKGVDFCDAGLYFCGFYIKAHTVISSATELRIQDNDESRVEVDCKAEECDNTTDLMSLILGGVAVFLAIVVIALAVKIWKLQTDGNKELQGNKRSDELNYAALSFRGKAKRGRSLPSEREIEPHVVYAATR